MSAETATADRAVDRELLIAEVVAYFEIYDFHEVWKRKGAASLVDWLLARNVITATGKPATPATKHPDYHLMGPDGSVLCGKPDATVIDHECPDCNRIEWARVCEPIR